MSGYQINGLVGGENVTHCRDDALWGFENHIHAGTGKQRHLTS